MEREEILEKIEQLKKQLEELNGQIIDFELPKNYEKMSKEEKKAYHKKQEQLKRKALGDMENYSVVGDNYTMVTYPKTRSIVAAFKKEVWKNPGSPGQWNWRGLKDSGRMENKIIIKFGM